MPIINSNRESYKEYNSPHRYTTKKADSNMDKLKVYLTKQPRDRKSTLNQIKDRMLHSNSSKDDAQTRYKIPTKHLKVVGPVAVRNSNLSSGPQYYYQEHKNSQSRGVKQTS